MTYSRAPIYPFKTREKEEMWFEHMIETHPTHVGLVLAHVLKRIYDRQEKDPYDLTSHWNELVEEIEACMEKCAGLDQHTRIRGDPYGAWEHECRGTERESEK